jgi:phosphoribosylaminoimidazolecarboxamide formyltransferase/IMP cyclohydrolase
VTPSKRAILSVWDKTGLLPFASGLHRFGYELVASGGTARHLASEGLPVTEIDDVTGHPEILGGRVKTLHPAVHGGILARGTPEHLEELRQHGIGPVDLVVCNLYPFERTIAQPGVSELEAIEQIDIGGVTLLRAAAKNHERVAIVCDPAAYEAVLGLLEADGLDLDARRKLALAAFQQTAAYDLAISNWFQARVEGEAVLPSVLTLRARKVQTLRYGENSHQEGALYRFEGSPPAFEQVGGDKELSYNNLADLEAAWGMPAEFDRPAVAIIKHANPSGLAVADDLIAAFNLALRCDPISAFGGIVATNRLVDAAFVQNLGKLFVEVIAAPAFSEEAIRLLTLRKKGCRLMRWTGRVSAPTRGVREVHGGLLVQTADNAPLDTEAWKVVSRREPTEQELRDLRFAWIACKHVKSNAIVFAKDEATVGVGAGQMNRADSVRIAGWRAGELAQGSVMASDAFFPFADGIEAAVQFGLTAVIQPGGSIRDDEVIAKVDELGLAMIFTGRRHFRH